MFPFNLPGACVMLDASNLMHRYFHAMPTQVGRGGHNVNAARGLGDLVSRLRAGGAAAIVAVFDAGHSRREALLPAYKAHRDGTPPELAYQLEVARQFLPRHPFHWCDTLHVPPFEADDVIAALVRPTRASGREVVIVSNDKDLAHLVPQEPPTVRLLAKDAAGWSLRGAGTVEARHGVGPALMLDFLALCGDAADGIPGVPGVGPKTAATLLARFGGLEQLLDSVDQVEREALRTRLREHAELARLSRQVVAPALVPVAEIDAHLRRARGSSGWGGVAA